MYHTNIHKDHTTRYCNALYLLDIGYAASHIGWNGHINLLGVRQVEIGHDFDKLILGLVLAQTRIGFLFSANGGTQTSLIIVCRVDNGGIRQVKELRPHGLVQRFGRAALKVGTATTLNQQRIPCQDKGIVIGHVRHTTLGMSRRGTDLQIARTKDNAITRFNVNIGLGLGGLGNHRLKAINLLFQQVCASNMVRMCVCVDCYLKSTRISVRVVSNRERWRRRTNLCSGVSWTCIV